MQKTWKELVAAIASGIIPELVAAIASGIIPEFVWRE